MQKALFRLVSPGCFCANKRAAGPKSFDSRPQIKTLGTTQVENPQRAGFCPKKELQGGGAPKRPRIGQKGLKITISAQFGSNHRFFLIKVSKKHQITPKRRSDVIGHPWQGSPASSAPWLVTHFGGILGKDGWKRGNPTFWEGIGSKCKIPLFFFFFF